MSHLRDNRSILAGPERRLLVHLARNLPTAIHSDQLSALALAAMLGAGVSFALISRSGWFAAVFVGCLIANWFGDSLDGTLARVRGVQRPRYGFYVDHAIDLAGTAALVAGMALSGLMTPVVGFALLAAYLMVAAESFLATCSAGVFRMSFAGFGPTELRILLAAGAIKIAGSPTVELMGRSVLLLDVGGAVAIVGLGVAFVVSAISNGLALYRAEPLPVVNKQGVAARAPQGVGAAAKRRVGLWPAGS
jgi:phosphatidylglycerophosphate synthase